MGPRILNEQKKINAYFREEFSKLREELEDEDYFKKKLFLSFLYKENEIVKQVKEDFRINKSAYFELNKHIPKDATLLHIADDYGQIDILLSLQQANRKIFSLIPDIEKREIADHNYLVKKKKNKLYIHNFRD
ncbi:hypothetical protein [Chryseobacterium proteolyticum]|uniref:hypothetical protein n=1 Tax=Chryseobacterium proteolyticum TaxID=118127 RepID=UPI003982F98C